MTKKAVITMRQLFVLFFISRIIVNLTYTPLITKSPSMGDHVISALISFVLTFFMALPIYNLSIQRKHLDIAEYSFLLLGKLGFIFVTIYALYFLFVCIYSLSLFDIFVSNIISPQLSLVLLSSAIIVTSCYGAFKGIEAIVRTSGIILILICIAMIFIVIAFVPKIDSINYEPIMYNGNSSIINGTILMIATTSCIPAMAMLLPMAKGNAKSNIFWWSFATYSSIAIMIIIIVGSLGDYLKTQMFPVYSAVSIAEIGMLKHLDILYLGVWTSGLFIKIALFLYLFSLCVEKMFGQKAARCSILLGGFCVVITSVLLSGSKYMIDILFNIKYLFIGTIIVSILLPVILLVVDSLKNNIQEGGNKNEL